MKKLYASLLMFVASTGVYSQAIQISASSLDFGALNYGTKDSIAVELTNLLDEAVTIEVPVFFDFYVSSPFYVTSYPETIGAGASEEMYVVFDPVHNMDHNSELVIKTSGNRGAVSLDLRGECHYDMPYYDDTYDLLDENLKLALKSILSSGYQQSSYNDARDEMFMVIDNQAVNGQGASENTVTCVYTAEDAVGYANRAEIQNSPFLFDTEHIFPQGFFDQNLPMRSDLHHLAPTKSFANNARGSLRFGEVVSGAPVGGGGSFVGESEDGLEVFEPLDAQKGPSARAIMYFVVRYQNYSSHMSFQLENVCREWHVQFPPSAADITRNEDIFEFQNNRNPFVDYPQFADRIYAIRFEQNRPNTGILALSHESIDFGVVEDAAAPVAFNLVLTNPGERFISISNLGLANDGNGAYALDAGQPSALVLNKGESLHIPVYFEANGNSSTFEGSLVFNTNLSGSQEVVVPISASTVLATARYEDPAYQLIPNPFTSMVWFSDPGITEQVRFVRVFDISGRLCVDKAVQTNGISLQNLDAGLYHVAIEDHTGRQAVYKMIKQ